MRDIFDTDFDSNDRVYIYLGGEYVYGGTVSDVPYELRRHVYDWFILDPAMEEGYKVVFIG